MNKNLQFILIGVGALFAVGILFSRTAEQKKEDAALGFTDETGPIGVLGAQTNRVLGGVPAEIGSFFAGVLSDIREAPSDLDPFATGPISDVTGLPIEQ